MPSTSLCKCKQLQGIVTRPWVSAYVGRLKWSTKWDFVFGLCHSKGCPWHVIAWDWPHAFLSYSISIRLVVREFSSTSFVIPSSKTVLFLFCYVDGVSEAFLLKSLYVLCIWDNNHSYRPIIENTQAPLKTLYLSLPHQWIHSASKVRFIGGVKINTKFWGFLSFSHLTQVPFVYVLCRAYMDLSIYMSS